MKLIGLTGPAGVGKTCVAKTLDLDFGFHEFAFAWWIKSALATAFDLPTKCFTDRELKEQVIERLGKSPRELMRAFGTDFVRVQLGEDVWVNQMERLLDSMHPGSKIVVSDVRYPNEAELIRSKGGTIWHLSRPDVEWSGAHSSEKGIEFDSRDKGLLCLDGADGWKELIELALGELK